MSDSHLRAVRRAFTRAAPHFDAAAAVHGEVRNRLLERLDGIRGEPAILLDLGAGTGQLSRTLKRRFKYAHVVALDVTEAMLREARHQQSFLRRFERVCADAARLPLASQSIDWCISNLALPWCEAIVPVFAEVARVLRPGGLFSFSTLGPDTLHELRRARRALDPPNALLDMHDIGDALLRAGFAEPVMDVERIVLTYRDPQRLFRELKDTGFAVHSRPTAHLGARKILRELVNAYESLRVEGQLPATFEIVYGFAWRGEPKQIDANAGEVKIPLGAIGRRRRE